MPDKPLTIVDDDDRTRSRHPDALDVERGNGAAISSEDASVKHEETSQRLTSGLHSWLNAYGRAFMRDNFEARGIKRVRAEERHDMRQLGLTQMMFLWMSVNLPATVVTLGMLGPVVYYLPFLDCSLCAVIGSFFGSIPVAYVGTFGPRSGNRTMVLTRYIMGWWPAKLVVILTLVNLLGYAIINTVVVGQILSAVSTNASMSIIVGIVIAAVITWAVSTFGYSFFHLYLRYAWLPELIVLCLLAGVAGPNFDLYNNPSQGLDERTVIGNRLSFFSLSFSAAVTYASGGADYFVYYPETTPRWKVFAVIMVGLSLSFTFTFMVGIGLGSGVASNTDWSHAYGVSQGALIVEAFRPLGGFGSFCSVLVALGLISNLIPGTYSIGLDFQVLGRFAERTPRVLLNSLGVVIYMVCAIAGRAHLAEIFTNVVALMGYFVSIWIAIFLEEHFLFRKWRGLGWDWEVWNDRHRLPVGIAALIAFLVGWAGAILCMAQVWYIGPLAALVGDYGGDMGNYVGFSWAALVYAPLRWLELRKFGR